MEIKPSVLITGVAGFVGMNFASHLIDQGYSVIGLDIADKFKRLKNSKLLTNKSFTFKRVDLSEDKSVDLFKKNKTIKAIYHLAALAHVDYSYYFPSQVLNNNINSLLNVLDLAITTGTPLIFSSSVEVYGGKEELNYKEDDLLAPLSTYAASKVACEAIIKSFIETQGLKATIFRFTNLYGPWQSPDRLIPRVISQVLMGYNAKIERGTFRDLLYIGDACEALSLSLGMEHNGEIYNLSSGKKTDNFQVAQLTTVLIKDNSKIQIVPPKEGDGRGRFLISNPQKLTKRVNWRQKTDLNDGLDRTYSWYQSNLNWLKQFSSNLRAERDSSNFLVDGKIRKETNGKKS